MKPINTQEPNKIKKIDESKVNSYVAKAVLSDPTIKKSLQSIYLAKLRVDSIEADKNTKLMASSSAGFLDEYETEVSEVAFGTLRADRLIDDNNQLGDSIKIGEINTEIGIATFNLEINRGLQDILKAYNQVNVSLKTIEILNKYLKKYEAREELIQKAVIIGAISNSEFLELKGLKNEALTKLAKSELLRKKSDNILKIRLNEFYDLSMFELKSKIRESYFEDFKSSRNIRAEIINLKKKKLDIEISIEKKRLRPTNKISASATSPQSKSKSLTLFAGLTIDFPIRDGGKSATQVKLLEKQKLILELEENELRKKESLNERQWLSFSYFFNNQKKLLEDRLKISKRRLKELELLQRQGRVNSSAYVKEILTVANTEVDIINLNASYFEEVLKRAELTSNTCALLKICKELEGYIKSI